jgi:hypothetical protein
MESIDIAFKWGKPAIVGAHRINFAGRLGLEQRDKNLEMLDQLLTRIIKRWPNVQFIHSQNLLKELNDA